MLLISFCARQLYNPRFLRFSTDRNRPSLLDPRSRFLVYEHNYNFNGIGILKTNNVCTGREFRHDVSADVVV